MTTALDEQDMAHELDTNAATGEAAMLSVVETPWHRLGVILDSPPSLVEALGLAGLDWEVRKVAHYADLEDGLADGERLPRGTLDFAHSSDSYSVVRWDRHEVIGTVGNAWQPLQNVDAFAPVEPLLDAGLATIETAGVLRNGKQVWMLIRFDTQAILERIEAGGADKAQVAMAMELFGEVLPYGLFTNDHSGGAKARIKETGVRVVCANTMGWALGKDEEGFSVEVGHTGDVTGNYMAAADMMLTGMANRYASLANYRDAMRNSRLTDRDFKRLVLEPVVPIRHLEAKIQRREDSPQTRGAFERAHRRRNRLGELWHTGHGHVGDSSVWEAFQGLVQWCDHEDDVPGAGNRLTSLHDGTLGQIKQQAFRRLYSYATKA